MAIKFIKEKLDDNNIWKNEKILKEICEIVDGFGEFDYKHITEGVLKILEDEKLIESKF